MEWEALNSEYRDSLLEQLSQVPNPPRDTWEKRLKAKEEHQHFSVRLEIYLYNFFKERGWDIEVEPPLPGTPYKPEFRLTQSGYELILEAKTVFDDQPVEQQHGRLRELAMNLSGRLKRTVSIQPAGDLPSSLPYKGIAREIEKKACGLAVDQEFPIEIVHQGQRYQFAVTLLLDYKPSPTDDVGVMVSDAYNVSIGSRMREAVIAKAGKYGKLDVPFVIAVWPKGTHFSYPHTSNDDLVALYGDIVWEGPNYAELSEKTKRNGPFNEKRADGTWRYAHVSAVAVAQLDGRLPLRVYHNPNASQPLDTDIFKAVSQCFIDLNTGKEIWIDPMAPLDYDFTDPVVAYAFGLTDEIPEELVSWVESQDWDS